jgi:hypothetical protein
MVGGLVLEKPTYDWAFCLQKVLEHDAGFHQAHLKTALALLWQDRREGCRKLGTQFGAASLST